ncbi:MAG: hypothetical protein A3K60_04540 [Euryarchaeota archaeon RBG_19FT_COMBO_56_21]|nr:MAG: hypothetical protein A3K60_04540 [Euryarchaeota archaeon RBG_19FT_COMBO_56_21]
MAKGTVGAAFLCAIMMVVGFMPLVAGSDHVVTRGDNGPGASARTWTFTAPEYGQYSWRIENFGLKWMVMQVSDNSNGVPIEVSKEHIRFAASDAYPTGIVYTSPVIMAKDRIYDITAVPNGPKGTYAIVTDPILGMPPEADYVLTIHQSDIYTVHADGSTSYSPNGMIVSYVWDFGDGSTATGMTADHTYSSIGLFPITLTVTDNIGLQDTAQFWVHIYPVFVDFVVTVIDYTVTVDAGFIDPGGMIASYAWDWGDGATGSGVIATHTYAVAGTYIITLVTTDYYGNTEGASRLVTVPNPLT